MDFFETIAIAVEQGCLDIELVDRMLRMPIMEVRKHPAMSKLWQAEEPSCEGFKYLIGRLDEFYSRPDVVPPDGWNPQPQP